MADNTTRGDDPEVTAHYYDSIAATYDAQVDGTAKNGAIRDAFRELVSASAGPGGLILDFGCGTGADAGWYGARGHHVVAYDISSRMVDLLRVRCAAQIEAGLIVPLVGGVDVLEADLDRVGRMNAIAANFAVLSHVRDLPPLLRRLASHLAPGGLIIANVLNPWYWHDMKRAWWWRGVLRSPWSGAIRLAGDVTTYRYFKGTIRRAAAPSLMVEEVRASTGARWVDLLRSNFLFVLLRKRP